MGAASGRRVTGTGATVIVAVALLAACTSDDDSGSTPSGADEVAGVGLDTTTTAVGEPEPVGTEPADVVPYVEELLDRYDEVLGEIVADPAVARDPDDPLVGEFLGLFEPGSDFAEGSLDGWADMADEGVSYEPGAGDPGVNETNLEGPPTAVGEDEVGFGHCTVQHYVTYVDGEETDRVDRRLLPGNGWVVRVDGHWLLRELTTPPGLHGCLTGSGVGG